MQNTAAEKPRRLTVAQVATMLGVSEQTIYKMAQKGELPAFRVGKQWRFDAEAVEKRLAVG